MSAFEATGIVSRAVTALLAVYKHPVKPGRATMAGKSGADLPIPHPSAVAATVITLDAA